MQAIILKKNIFDESSEIITFYTREQGKVRAVARAVKSAKSKLAHALETLFYSEIELLPNHRLPTITGVKLLHTFRNLRNDIPKVYAALFAAELILKSTPDEQPNPELFDDFFALLQHLDEDNSASQHRHLCAEAFAMRLLEHSGYGLTFGKCLICGSVLNASGPAAAAAIFFSPRKGGFLCADCARNASGTQAVGSELYAFLESTADKTYTELDQNGLPLKQVHTFVHEFAGHVLERNLNAAKYLATLR